VSLDPNPLSNANNSSLALRELANQDILVLIAKNTLIVICLVLPRKELNASIPSAPRNVTMDFHAQ
jgi:hypothetical protein